MYYSKKGIDIEECHIGGRDLIKWDSVKKVRYKNPVGPATTAIRYTYLIRDEDLWRHDQRPSESGLQITYKDVGKLLVVDEQPDGEFIDYIVEPPEGRTLGDGDPWARNYVKEAQEIVGNVRKDKPQIIQFPLAAGGKMFNVKKHPESRGYFLGEIDSRTLLPRGERGRFGNKAQMIEDVAHVLEYGTLPPPSGPRW